MIFLAILGLLVFLGWFISLLTGWLIVAWGEWALYPFNWRIFVTPDVYMRWVDSRHPIGDNKA